MSGNDDRNSRQARMLAMRKNFQQDSEIKFGGGNSGGDEFNAGADRRKGLRRGQDRAVGQGGSSPLLQKVYKFLTQSGPGMETVPGTNICKDRIKQTIEFLRQRSKVLEGKKAQRVQRLLQYLTAEKSGDQMVSGVNINHLSRFLERIEQRGQDLGETAESSMLEHGSDSTAEEEEYVYEEADPQIETLEATLHQLVDITSRMSEQLQETQMRVDRMAHEKGRGKTVDAERVADDEKSSGEEDWFAEYLD